MTEASNRFNAAAAHHDAIGALLARVKQGDEATAELATVKAQLATMTQEYDALLTQASTYLEGTTAAIVAEDQSIAPASALSAPAPAHSS